MLNHDREEQVIKLCQALLKVRSYSGEEGQVVSELKRAFETLGYDDVFVDEYGSIVGHLKGKRPGKSILLDGHLDTVPVINPAGWAHDPWGGEIDGGRIYGRGASDMKGAVAAMTCAAAFLAQDLDHDFAGDIYVAGVVHEECFEGVACRSISSRLHPDYVIIGEASNCNLRRGQKGRAEIVVETLGKPAHSASPQEGINAVYHAARLIENIKSLELTQHPVLGKGILELTDIQSLPYPGASVVPERCRMTYDRRLLVGETPESVLAPIQDLIIKMQANDPNFKATVNYAHGQERCYTGNVIEGERYFPAWLIDEDDELIGKALQALRGAGFSPEVSCWNFCTNGSHYAGEAGIKTMGFGPSLETLAHTIDEYIEIEQLVKATRGYYEILKAIEL